MQDDEKDRVVSEVVCGHNLMLFSVWFGWSAVVRGLASSLAS